MDPDAGYMNQQSEEGALECWSTQSRLMVQDGVSNQVCELTLQ